MNTYIIGSHTLEFAVSWSDKTSPWNPKYRIRQDTRSKKKNTVGYFLRVDRTKIYKIVRPCDFVNMQQSVAKLRRGNTAGLDDYLRETLSEKDRFVREPTT